MLNFQAIKNCQKALNKYNYHESSNCFEYHQKNLLKSNYQKRHFLKFFYLRNPKIENVKPKKIL